MLEFALVALPVLLLLLGTFDIGFLYWGRKELEHATNHGARLVRVGQVQASGWTAEQLKSQICTQTSLLTDCNDRLRIDVQSAVNFGGFAAIEPLDASGNIKPDSDFGYQPGGANDTVLVRAFYSWKTMLIGELVLRAAVPLRNEPF